MSSPVRDRYDDRARSRSRSPRRSKPRADRGFRWKEKRPKHTDEAGGDEQRLDRGYKDRDTRHRHETREDVDQPRKRRRSRSKDGEDVHAERHDDIAAKFGSEAASTAENASRPSKDTSSSKPSKPKKPAAPKAPSQPMIRVTVNDRLGTKSVIPCLPSDNIGDFKKLVAARIGRKPHEIMLKRQSERPFKDILTLEDYGVSDGVQLDLELDTGD